MLALILQSTPFKRIVSGSLLELMIGVLYDYVRELEKIRSCLTSYGGLSASTQCIFRRSLNKGDVSIANFDER